MKIKFIEPEDFINYKKPSMFIGTTTCTFKCERECPDCHCQNSSLANAKIIDILDDTIISMYNDSDISKAIVFGGLEPIDQFEELILLISKFRKHTDDDIVIYTGYTEEEIADKVEKLQSFKNIVIKFGRYRTNEKSHYDNVLGIELVSDNQYAKKIS